MPFEASQTPNPTRRKLTAIGLGAHPFGPYEDLHVEYRHIGATGGGAKIRGLNEARVECPPAFRILNKGFLTVAFDQAIIFDKGALKKASSVTLGVAASEIGHWLKLEHDAKTILNEEIVPGKPVFNSGFQCPEGMPERHTRVKAWARAQGFEDDAIDTYIKPILQTVEEIAPYIRADGGDIKYVSFDIDKDKVYIDMTGACSGCPSTKRTLTNMANRVYQLGQLKVDFEPTGPATPTTAYNAFILD